jgi:hypothetical protein
MNTIRVIPFYGKVDEWPIWSERFLAKSRRFGFKDLPLGKLSIPKVDEKFDEGTESGKKKSIAIEMNEIAYTKLILVVLESSGYQCQDRIESATVATFFFPGRYSNITPYSSRSKIQHVSKTRYEAFKSLKVLFLWSLKTMMAQW